MMLKISHKAITKLAAVGNRNNATGASAIFKLFQARPALLEKRIKRPPAATAAATGDDSSRRHIECSGRKQRRAEALTVVACLFHPC
jgi:hypothetical protein